MIIWQHQQEENSHPALLVFGQKDGIVRKGENYPLPGEAREGKWQMIPSGDIKILLVEDDEGLRKSLSLFLRCQGYKLLALKTGEQAMEAATRTRYDIILCDYCLSDMNGLEFLRWAGGTQSDAIRVLTAVHGDNLVGKEEAIKGIHGVIRKPFTGEEIQNLLMLLMEGCR